MNYVGGANPEDACKLRRLGECVDTLSEFCNSGGDWICPSGFEITTGTKTNTMNDCDACPAGSFCGNRAKTTCEAGYQCPAYSTDSHAYAAQPGDFLPAGATGASVSTCTNGNYCPGATGVETACPAGTNQNFGGATDTLNFNALSCEPDDAGLSCAAGKYCPEASATNTDPISCQPGTFNTGASGKNQDDCSDCTAGKFCATGSTAATGSCPDGSYCPARTIFDQEYGCPAGKTSLGTSSPPNEAACTDCTAGDFCRQGEVESNLCDAKGYACPTGSAKREWCDAGTFTATGTKATSKTCTSCNPGSQCSGYGGEVACKPGYFGVAGSENCAQTTAGNYATNAAQPTETAAGVGKWSIPGDIAERDCPAGYICDGAGTKTICSMGKYCPSGSSTETTPAGGSGMVNNEQGLWFLKPCPSGKECPAGVTTAPTDTTAGYYTIQG